MKRSQFLCCALLLLVACWTVPSVARGGRGRGGGSFGGLFGGWRSKYGSKSSSSGGGRRVVSGSPVHTAMTVPKLPPPPPPPPKPMSMPKPQMASYPRQQLPPGYNYAASPGQGTFYANAQALPAGAVYYGQPPMSMSPGASGFLTGMLAGRLMDSMMYGNRHRVAHVYHQNQPTATSATGNGREVIIINNGQQEAAQPLNETLREEDNATSTDTTLSESGEQQFEREEDEQPESSSFSEETAETTAVPEPSPGGIICFPITLNETDPQNSELVREVQRVVCFPAPTTHPQASNIDCQNDPQCLVESSSSTTTSTVPPIVAGDIGGAVEYIDSMEVTSTVPDAEPTENKE